VIDPVQLANDIAGNVTLLVFPAVLWALLYLLAWEHGAFAESLGLGRRAFWLLLPGALLATLVLLPIAPISNDWLAISYAGALFPLFVGGLAFGRFAPPAARTLPTFVALLAVETTALLVLVILDPHGSLESVGVVGIAAAVPLAAGLGAVVAPEAKLGRVAVLLGLTSGVLVFTFFASSAIPGVGIEESFPAYLLAPVGAGLVAVAIADRVFPRAEALALPAAFFAATVGVLVGADALRQPPLYGSGPAGLYAVGGAGVLDLVYLSGLLALSAAYVGHRLVGRGLDPVPGTAPPPGGTPLGRLARALRAGVAGRIGEALEESSAASHAAAGQARELLEVPEAPAHRPWEGLPVPGWVVSDQANLDAAARSGSTDGREGFRGYLTARWLVLIGRELSARRYATVGARTGAFALDLVVVTAPAVALWSYLLLTVPGTLNDLATSVGYNAAIYAYAGLAFLYFAVLEAARGRTVGKWLLGIEVRDRALERPSFLSSLVRNASKLPTLSVLGLGLGVGLLLLFKAGSTAGLSVAGLALPVGLFDFVAILAFVIGGVGLFGAVGLLVIVMSSERQRFGDLVAGTWVVRAAKPATSAPPATAAGPSG
jgi:uncharacterized RDD family membrane protein YckC